MSSYRIVPPDPGWPIVASQEIKSIVGALKPDPHQVVHIGSTAVPGLGAKPIIDLMLGIPEFDAAQNNQKHIKLLEQIGYEYKGTQTILGTYYIRKAFPRRFNLHMTELGGSFWIDHLLFRNYLRSHSEAARQYEDLKRNLLERLGPDPDKQAYNDGKGDFISTILEKAHS